MQPVVAWLTKHAEDLEGLQVAQKMCPGRCVLSLGQKPRVKRVWVRWLDATTGTDPRLQHAIYTLVYDNNITDVRFSRSLHVLMSARHTSSRIMHSI